jgi:hypothetical protein
VGASLAWLAPPALAADPSAADKETSRNLYAEGMHLLDVHDYAGAERACRGAHSIVQVPPASVCLGRALDRLGRLVEARDAFMEAAHYPEAAGEPKVFAEARTTAGAEADKLATRIPTLVITVTGAPDTAALKATIDGAAIGTDTVRLPRKVDPGKHIVIVSAPGFRQARSEVNAVEGQEQRVAVSLEPAPKDEAAVLSAPSSAPLAPASSKVPAFIALGVGGVGVVVGSIFGVVALSDASSLKAQAGCPSSCPASARSQIDSLHGAQWISDVGLGIGVVGLGVGAALLFTAHVPEGSPATSLGLDIGPGGVGVHGGF